MHTFHLGFDLHSHSVAVITSLLLYGGTAWAQASCPQSPPTGEDCTVTIQAPKSEYRQLGQVEIYGVAITGTPAKEAQPVQLIDRRTLERSPATHLGELLQHLPALLPRDVAGLSGSMEVAAVHGDTAGTLVLINGQRLPTAGRPGWRSAGQGVDLRFLPLSAIERIEVNTPGASSALGADGISGIVNIITRGNTPSAIGAEYLSPATGLGDGRSAQVAWGQGRLDNDGYTLQLHAALSQRTPLAVSATSETWRAAPTTTRQQWFMTGEWRVSPSWTGFGHWLGTHESPQNNPWYSAGAMPSASPQGFGPVGLSEQQRMHQVQLGLKGPWRSWDVTAAVASGEDWNQQETHVNASQDTGWVPSNVGELRQDKRASLQTLNMQAVREFDGPDLGLHTLGLGWQWRRESLSTQLSDSRLAQMAGQRQVWAMHAEIKTHLTEQHQLTATVRHDHYSDVGDAQTGELAWKWRPHKQWMVRASWGSGFRAPELDQLSPQPSQTTLLWDPLHLNELTVRRSGQAQLKAERSSRATWGFRLEPHPRWTLGADFWQLDVKQAIGYRSPAALQAAGLLQVDAHGAYLDAVAMNLGRTRKQGIDYDSEWRLPSDAGLLRLSVKGTLYLKSTMKEALTGRTVSDLGYFSGTTPFVTPRHKMVWGASLEQGDWVLMSGLRYRSAYREAPFWPTTAASTVTPAEHKVPAYWRLDLGAQWRINRQLSLSAWVLDVTQHSRLQALTENTALPVAEQRNPEDTGRMLKLKLIYKI